MKKFIPLLCLLLVALGHGCSGDSTHGKVKGTVTYQGEPVTEGQIVFRRTDNSVVEGAIIKDGLFESNAPIGTCLVQITARKKVQAKANSSALEEDAFTTVSYIPEKYNDKSTLSLEVKSGSQTYDFLLE